MLGTPAYMPPEQAVGAVDKVDARADVFGLGAILRVILTGKPPYVGRDGRGGAAARRPRGKLDDCFARLDACGAEPELVALCKRCLAAEPADRPADAGEVAEAVGRTAGRGRGAGAAGGTGPGDGRGAGGRAAEAAAGGAGGRRRVAAVLLFGMAGDTVGLVRAERARRDA